MSNIPKNLKRKRKELALKERRLRKAGAFLDRSAVVLERTEKARDAALRAAEAKGRRKALRQALGTAENSRTIRDARHRIGKLVEEAEAVAAQEVAQ